MLQLQTTDFEVTGSVLVLRCEEAVGVILDEAEAEEVKIIVSMATGLQTLVLVHRT